MGQLKMVEVPSEFKQELEKQVSGSITGIDRVLVENLIDKLCSVNDFVDDLCQHVLEEGVMIEKEVGTVNNRHVELVENPSMSAYSKMVKVLADVSMKVARVAKGATSEDEDGVGDLVAWNRARRN